jgi:hypothetical protein
MARYEHLAIYRTAHELSSVVIDYVANFPRPFKPTLGLRLQQLSVKIAMRVSKANSAQDKVPHLDRLLERKQELEYLLRICEEKRFISRPQYARAIELTSSVGKQANGWRRYASPAT